ncbi:hypothetical protein M569_05952 [Genlisea aurea]|uniref:Uncharacterized protein n=1 Tax=Genlisea aurea TaxID=192259 RepID=S8E8M0_9LAMI|nr:hypothetical protein M569_05952 [Genlisea aurea]
MGKSKLRGNFGKSLCRPRRGQGGAHARFTVLGPVGSPYLTRHPFTRGLSSPFPVKLPVQDSDFPARPAPIVELGATYSSF